MKKLFIYLPLSLFLIVVSIFIFLLTAYNWTDKISLLSYRFEPGTKIEIVWQDNSVEHLDFVYSGNRTLELRTRPDSLIKNWVVSTSGEKIFEAAYEVDEWGRRKTPNKNQNADKHAVFFGCSDLFGMGVKFDETIPSLFAENTEDYTSYNYGYVGSSPAYFLKVLETYKFAEELKESSGVVFYVMTEGHYPKTIGKFGHMHQPEMPVYDFVDKEKTEIEFIGSYEDLYPLMTKFKRHTAGSLLNRVIDPNSFTFYSQEDDELVCAIVAKTGKVFSKSFPSSELVYFLHDNIRDHDRKMMKDCLEKNQLKFVDAQLDYYDADAFETSSIDRHPTGTVNYEMVKKMVSYLQKND